MEGDLKAEDNLGSLQRPLAQLIAGIEDSMLADGSEAYGAALPTTRRSRARVQGAEAIANDLGHGGEFIGIGITGHTFGWLLTFRTGCPDTCCNRALSKDLCLLLHLAGMVQWRLKKQRKARDKT